MYVSLPRAPQISMTHFWTTKMGKSQPKHKSQLSLRHSHISQIKEIHIEPIFLTSVCLQMNRIMLLQELWLLYNTG